MTKQQQGMWKAEKAHLNRNTLSVSWEGGRIHGSAYFNLSLMLLIKPASKSLDIKTFPTNLTCKAQRMWNNPWLWLLQVCALLLLGWIWEPGPLVGPISQVQSQPASLCPAAASPVGWGTWKLEKTSLTAALGSPLEGPNSWHLDTPVQTPAL